MTKRMSHSEYVTRLAVVKPTIEVMGPYVNSSTKIHVRCKNCGHEWEPKARSILYTEQGCPVCRKKAANERQTKTPEQFDENLRLVSPHILRIGPYINSNYKVKVRCSRCGNVWEVKPGNVLNGSGCPNCSKGGTSFSEQFIYQFFVHALGKDAVRNRDSSVIGKELDVVVPGALIAVEFGSWYWHKNRVAKDIEKLDRCESRGITLFTIYDCFHDTQAPPIANCMTFDFSLAEEQGHVTLKKICSQIYRIAYSADAPFINWKDVELEAFKACLKTSTEEFKAEIELKNQDVEVIGEYQGAHGHVKCRCLQCGYSWQSVARNLLNGSGCPRCRRKSAAAAATAIRRLGESEFVERLRVKNPSVEYCGGYEDIGGLSQKVEVRCKKCGGKRFSRASSLLKGTGCPQCSKMKKSKAPEQFKAEIGKLNPDIEILDEYRKSSEKIACKCCKCSFEWSARPSDLLNGHGCPKCAGKLHRKVRCLETGNVYPSLAAAGRDCGLSSGDLISLCCRGQRETAGGYHWEFFSPDPTTGGTGGVREVNHE